MPKYESDLTGVTATLEVFSKGEYEFAIGEPKAFARNKRDELGNETDQVSWGVRYPLKVTEVHDGDPNAKGKRSIVSLYLATDGGKSMSKGFVMAANGFEHNSKGEEEFNEQFAGQDWSVDPETGAVGDVWRTPNGKRAIATLDVQENNRTQEPMQQFQRWRPVG